MWIPFYEQQMDISTQIEMWIVFGLVVSFLKLKQKRNSVDNRQKSRDKKINHDKTKRPQRLQKIGATN